VGHPSITGLASQPNAANPDTSSLVSRVDVVNKIRISSYFPQARRSCLLSHLDMAAIQGVRQSHMQQPLSGSLSWPLLLFLFSPGCMRGHGGGMWGIR
jgi:hypothetical protein